MISLFVVRLCWCQNCSRHGIQTLSPEIEHSFTSNTKFLDSGALDTSLKYPWTFSIV